MRLFSFVFGNLVAGYGNHPPPMAPPARGPAPYHGFPPGPHHQGAPPGGPSPSGPHIEAPVQAPPPVPLQVCAYVGILVHFMNKTNEQKRMNKNLLSIN